MLGAGKWCWKMLQGTIEALSFPSDPCWFSAVQTQPIGGQRCFLAMPWSRGSVSQLWQQDYSSIHVCQSKSVLSPPQTLAYNWSYCVVSLCFYPCSSSDAGTGKGRLSNLTASAWGRRGSRFLWCSWAFEGYVGVLPAGVAGRTHVSC